MIIAWFSYFTSNNRMVILKILSLISYLFKILLKTNEKNKQRPLLTEYGYLVILKYS